LLGALCDDGRAQQEIEKGSEKGGATRHPASCAKGEDGFVEGDRIGTETVQSSACHWVRMDPIEAAGDRFVDRDRELDRVAM
jgi:hypothetical protein